MFVVPEFNWWMLDLYISVAQDSCVGVSLRRTSTLCCRRRTFCLRLLWQRGAREQRPVGFGLLRCVAVEKMGGRMAGPAC